MKQLVIFCGTGKWIAFAEQMQYNRRVSVKFQPNAWCDEAIVHFWVKQCWKPACRGSVHLLMDVHKAQKTEAIQEQSITYTCVPGGCTYLVQPVDVFFNKPFMSEVEKLAHQYVQENLDA